MVLGFELRASNLLGRHSNTPPGLLFALVFFTARVLWIFFFFSVLGLELRAYTLSHSTSPFL
jgi:ABC-type uncharacterized transport system permease subunit